MPQQVGPQKSRNKNNKDKNITTLCDINFQTKLAYVLSKSNKIQESDTACGNEIAEFTITQKT